MVLPRVNRNVDRRRNGCFDGFLDFRWLYSMNGDLYENVGSISAYQYVDQLLGFLLLPIGSVLDFHCLLLPD